MTYAKLDYPPETLKPFGREYLTLEANTEAEQNMRVGAVDGSDDRVASGRRSAVRHRSECR